MNSRERVLEAMRRKPTDRVPFDFGFGFTGPQMDRFRAETGAEDPAEHFGADTRRVGIGPSRARADFRAWLGQADAAAEVDEWGVARVRTHAGEEGVGHLFRMTHPLASMEDPNELADYPLPDLDADYRYSHLPKQIAELHARGLPALAGMECTVFETAWYLRGMEQLMVDFLEESEFAVALLDRLTALRIRQAEHYALAGADILCLGDDVGSQRGLLMSAPMWRTWLKPRLAKVIEAAKSSKPDALIFYHSDGDVTDLLPELIEIGVDILNPVQPECMDPADLKRRFGDRLSFYGAIGTQTTLPFGSPNDVRREVRERIETMGRGGGLLLAPTHMIEPDVPWENILAFVQAVREFGELAVEAKK